MIRWEELEKAHRKLRRASSVLARVTAEEGWPLRLSPLRYLLLGHLCRATAFGQAPIRLARALEVRPSTLAYHLEELEKNGFVARHPGWFGDRRRVWVRLTTLGKYAAQRLESAL